MKEQDKTPTKTIKGSGDRQHSRKRIQNNDSEDDPGPWKKNGGRGFPGGTVVEGLPANAGDMGSNPGLGGSHMPRSN